MFFQALVGLLLLGLSTAVRLSEGDHQEESSPDLDLLPGESELIFIRHGKSLNNMFKKAPLTNVWVAGKMFLDDLVDDIANPFDVFKDEHPSDDFEDKWAASLDSEFKRGYEVVCNQQKLCGDYAGNYSSLSWEVLRWSRDCLLHPGLGEDLAIDLRKSLGDVLPPGFFNMVFVSPLRRTLQTALQSLGPWLNEGNTAVMPFIHERYKSDSDLANDGPTNSMFLERYANHMNASETLRGAVKILQEGLQTLGWDWVSKSGPEEPSTNQPDKPDEKDAPETYPYYPGYPGTFSKFENKEEIEGRMVIARKLLKKLPPGRYAFVAHGGIGEALFGKHLDNLGVVSARFYPKTAVPTDKKKFFHDVMLARDRWSVESIPGWQ